MDRGRDAGIAACATMLGTRRAKQPGEEIRQSHAVHGKDLPCQMCHEDVPEATTVTDHLRPPEAKCLECHSDKKEQKECGYCHTDPAIPGPTRPSLTPSSSRTRPTSSWSTTTVPLAT
jgi:hypothetical protein